MQDYGVHIIAAVAAIYLGIRLYRYFKRPGSGCSSCAPDMSHDAGSSSETKNRNQPPRA